MDDSSRQIIASLLRIENEEPTGTPADLERAAARYHGYRSAYE